MTVCVHITQLHTVQPLIMLLAAVSALLWAGARCSPQLEHERTFQTTLANLTMGYASASFSIWRDVV